MTADRLRKLLAAATRGPWSVSALTNIYGDRGDGVRDILLAAANWRQEDAILAAHAPDLAAWALEARDFAQWLKDLPADGPYAQPAVSSGDLTIAAHDLLAAFDRIGEGQ